MLKLQEKKIFHKDLKPELILIKNRNKNKELKIGSVKFACYNNDKLLMECISGKVGYIAPEILRNTHEYSY